MGVKVTNKGGEINYVLRRKGGRSIVDKKPVISPDEVSVLIISENVVRVYNIKTTDFTRVLESESSDANLISIEFPKDQQYNLYGFTEKGLVIIWTWENGVVLKEQQLQVPLHVDILTFNIIDKKECFVTGYNNFTKLLFYAKFSLHTGDMLYDFSRKMNITYNNIISVAIACTRDEKCVAICNGSRNLYIQNLVDPQRRAIQTNPNIIRILSVTAHPKSTSFLTTDTLGRAILMSGNIYSRNHNDVARERIHWHHMPLFAAAFTQEGNSVITGGLEKVLVKWTLGSLGNKARDLEFIPRLPGTVKHIATSRSYVVVSVATNAIIIADLLFKVQSTILECGGLSQAARAIGSTLTFIKPLNALGLGGRPGYLQIYSTVSDTVLYNVDITEHNDIPPSRENLIPLNTEVTCAGVNAHGQWLVTSEYRNDGNNYAEEKLKFWSITNDKTTPFILTTCVNLSHGGCKVISIALDSNGTRCITAGGDKKFRIWKREKPKRGANKPYWSCLTTCYYSSGIGHSLSSDLLNKFKSSDHIFDKSSPTTYPYLVDNDNKDDVIHRLICVKNSDSQLKDKDVNTGVLVKEESDMGGVAISQDGSLIAAWFGCKLTLWDSHMCTLRTTLSHMALRPKGVHVQFGNKDASHYLLCTTKTCLAVWSLLSLSVKWIVPISATCLTTCTMSNRVAVTTIFNDIIVFTPHDSVPIMHKKNVLDPNNGVIKYCVFGNAKDQKEFKLYVMRNDSELYSLESDKSNEDNLEMISHKNMPQTKFSLLVAEQQVSDISTPHFNNLDNSINDGLVKSVVSKYFSAAPHMMPSVSVLSSQFLEEISGWKKNEDVANELQEPELEHESGSEVQDSSDEEEPTLGNCEPAPEKKQFWTVNFAEVKEKRLMKIWKQPLLKKSIIELFTENK